MKLKTITGVELIEVGMSWHASTGDFDATEEDLQAVVASQSDPAVKTPRVKLGHQTTWGSAEPNYSNWSNLRLSDNGQVLLGDITGPEWLMDLLPIAYPNRSIEGQKGVTTNTGKKYSMLIDAVSLLGVYMPAVSTLEDLAATYGETMPEGVTIAAATNVDDVRRSFYDTVATDDKYWWWIHSLLVDPQEAIAEDDESGQLYRIPYTISGDSVEWGEPTPVKIEFKDQKLAASTQMGHTVAVFANRAQSRSGLEAQVDIKKLRETLNLGDDVSDEEVERLALQRLSGEQGSPGGANADEPETGQGELGPDEQVDSHSEEAKEGTPAPKPNTKTDAAAKPSTVTIDAATWAETQKRLQAVDSIVAERETQRREKVVDGAITAGKIPPARREAWLKAHKADPEGTEATLDNLESVLPTRQLSTDDVLAGAGGEQTQAAYDTSWLNDEERTRIAATREGKRVRTGIFTHES